MRRIKFMLFLFCICGLIFADTELKSADFSISDKKNVIDEDFLQEWNKILAITKAENFVKISVLIFDNDTVEYDNISSNNHEYKETQNESLETFPSPEILIVYNDTATGFEIFQKNFENHPTNSDFIIPQFFFNDIIPEANVLFKEGKTEVALEYILANFQETLYPQKSSEESSEITQNSDKIYYLYAISAFIVVFLFVILRKRNKPKNENNSYVFKGMSKDDFFGGGFDNI